MSWKIQSTAARSLPFAIGRKSGMTGSRWSTAVMALAVTVLVGAGVPGGIGVTHADGGVGIATPTGTPPAGKVRPVHAGRAVGTLGGVVTVGATGGLSWSTSLKVVPGINGMQPGLGISYTAGGYGGLGVGFSLSAGDTISRCQATIGQDGYHHTLTWSTSDALCLGGDRLVAVSGGHGLHGTQYRLQSAPTVRVVAQGDSTAAGSTFDVYTPDGRITRYGGAELYQATQWARREGALVPLAWHIAFVGDTAKNFMRYRYAGEAVAGEGVLTPADHRLVEIGYGENPYATLTTRRVRFDYVPMQKLLGQPNAGEGPGQVHQGYVAGMAQRREQILTDVHMEVRVADWQLVRSYGLRYEAVPAALADGNAPDRVRLTSLAECVEPVNGNGNIGLVPCFPPTRFEWSQGAPALVSKDGFGLDGVPFYPLPPADQLKTTPYQRPAAQVVGDFDADGDADFLVSPECINGAPEDCSQARWMLWPMDSQANGPVSTNIPAWSATVWTSRAGMAIPAQDVVMLPDYLWEDGPNAPPTPISPEPLLSGRRRDEKATPGAFAINYDGSYGTDVLVGEPVDELAGALMDTPWGLGSRTVTRRGPGTDAPAGCFTANGWGALSQAMKIKCSQYPARSKADYTAHPGVMRDLKVLRLKPGSQSEFQSTSLQYPQGRPMLWAQPLDMNGDGLSDLMFCKADADYAAVAGQSMPMFYPAAAQPVNWVVGTLHYAINAPGQGINLSAGGTPVTLTTQTRCHYKDAYLVSELYGDGRESLMHYSHRAGNATSIEGTEPFVPAGVVNDPFPYNAQKPQIDGYWFKLQEWSWAKAAVGEAFYAAWTYTYGQGVQRTLSGVPFEHFMRWQQPGNTRARYSTHQASSPDNPDGGYHGQTDMRDGRLTDWGDPGRPMTGTGPSEMRQGDINGDGLVDLLQVEQAQCFYDTNQLDDDGKSPLFKARGCTYQDVAEFGNGLLEQTHEKVVIRTYLNRGDGTFAQGDNLALWDTDMPSQAHLDALLGLVNDEEVYAEAWTVATTATRQWRMAFASSVMGDANGDGRADLGLMQMQFEPSGGWTLDSLAGSYRMRPVWQLARSSGQLSVEPSAMGIALDALVPASVKSGFPAWEDTLPTDQDTLWADSGDAYASTVTPYEQQGYGLAGRMMVMDVDHDGRDELLFYDHVRGMWEFATPQAMPQPQAELLTAVTDGLGARTQIDYAPQWTLASPAQPWTLDDLTLPYPLVSRPSPAAAVAALHTDTGQDAGDQPLFTTTRYVYGKSRSDVLRGVSLGIDRRSSTRWVQTPSGAVNTLRTERYDTTSGYDPLLRAYPLAGAPVSETTMVWGEPGEPIALSHSGSAYSGQPGIATGTWRRQLDATTATTFELGEDVPADTAGKLFACLVAAYDGAAQCTLGQSESEQPLSQATTLRQYDDYGYTLLETTRSAGSTTLTQQALEHRDTLNAISPYRLGLPTLEWVAHEPKAGAGYTVRTVANDYDVLGRLEKTTIEPNRPAYQSTQEYQYDVFGHVKRTTRSAQDQPDAVTKTTYGASGVYPVTVTNAAGHTQTTTWFEGCGMPEQVTNVLGHTQVNDIDTFCRDEGTRTYFGAEPLTRQTNISYGEWQAGVPEGYPDVELHVTREVVGGAKSHTLADRTGKVFVTQSPVLGFEVYTQTEYDALGRVTRTSLPTEVGEVPKGWTQQAYDARGRLVKLTKPDGQVRSTRYVRQVTEATDELGHTGRAQTNALDQVVKVTPPADPKLPGVDLSMCYVYGAYGVLRQAGPCTPTSAKGPTTLAYDDYGRLLSTHDAQAGLRTMRYDRLGRLDESEDALGQVTKQRYDVLDRVVERIQAYGTPQAKSATWTFDPVSGLLTAAVNADQTVTEVPLLDGKNRPAGMSATVHGRTYVTRNSYDDWGRVASQGYPSLGLFDPVITQPQHNALDQVIGLVFQNQTVWAPAETDVWGHLTLQQYGNGLKARATYEPDTGRLSEAKVYRDVQQGEDLFFEQALQHFTYSWYPNGLIERRINKAVNAQQSEQFDQFYYSPRGELDRWTTVGAQQQVKQQAMAYDGFGNIRKSPTGQYAYQGGRLQHIDGPLGKLSYLYDDNGQVTARIHPGGTTHLAYDALNQVAAIGEPQAKLRITYNADGRKVHVQDVLTGRETTYVGAYQEERGGGLGTAVIGRYALGPVHLTRTWNTKQGQLSYTDALSYTTPGDHLGSTTLVTSAKGAIEEVRSYGVWGEERNPDNWIAYQAAPKADLTGPNTGYTGTHERRRYGATSASGIGGLIDMQARYYDPAAGRFMAPDTLVPEAFNPLSWNRYTYVDNSPVAFTDPTGHAKQGEIDVKPHLGDFWEGMMSMVQGMGGGQPYGTGIVAGKSGAKGVVADTSALSTRKYGGAQSARGESMRWKSEITAEEKFWEMAYQRDLGNYLRAGMKPPFNNVEEYMGWRATSAAGQAMGISSQTMEQMANTAEQEQGRFMGGGEGAIMGRRGAGAAGRGAVRAAAAGSGPRWWWGAARRAAHEAAQAVHAAKRAIAERKSVDFASAAAEGQLKIKTIEGLTYVESHGVTVGRIYHLNPQAATIALDAKYATLENVTAIANTFKSQGGKLEVAFEFGTNAGAATAFQSQLYNTMGGQSGFRDSYGTVEVGRHMWSSDKPGQAVTHGVWIRFPVQRPE